MTWTKSLIAIGPATDYDDYIKRVHRMCDARRADKPAAYPHWPEQCGNDGPNLVAQTELRFCDEHRADIDNLLAHCGHPATKWVTA